jgi:hypothetical protein
MIYRVTTGPVIMETDSLELVGLWKNGTSQRSQYTPIFSESVIFRT